MKFKAKFLKDELDLPYSAIVDTVIDTRRWSIVHEIIFEYEGKHYQTTYSVGATERQEERPWDFEDEVECVEVRKVQKVVEVWGPVLSAAQETAP
jgi:hypothetical protein